MDIFDKYLYEELVAAYSRENLSKDDYDEIYHRFQNLEHLAEVKPYSLAMRYLGLGVPAEREAVLAELKSLIGSGDCNIVGLYYDLLLFENENDHNAFKLIQEMASKGYPDAYLKDQSHLHKEQKSTSAVQPKQQEPPASHKDPEKLVIKRMVFEGCGFSGYFFTTGDIDYLNAKVFIEPVKVARHIIVKSQIYYGDKPFSKEFTNEYSLKSGDTWFSTDGWGNKDFNCYRAGDYQWRVTIDGKSEYHHDFRFYGGVIDESGIPLKAVKLFASKASGATEEDRSNYKTAFDSSSLEFIYFRLFFDCPGFAKNIRIFRKVKCLEDDTVICNDYILQPLQHNWDSCWNGIGFKARGKWKKGLYQYSISFEKGSTYEGTFTVY